MDIFSLLNCTFIDNSVLLIYEHRFSLTGSYGIVSRHLSTDQNRYDSMKKRKKEKRNENTIFFSGIDGK
jgi:hypothetical protein